MKKYRIVERDKDGNRYAYTQTSVTMEDALSRLANFIFNENSSYIIEPFEEVPDEPKDVPELIPDYKAAVLYMHEGLSDSDAWHSMVSYCGPNRKAVIAFDELLALCRAWNKADGWEPDWTDSGQSKYHLVYGHTSKSLLPSAWWTQQYSPFVFKTEERARQFGEKFTDLFKQLCGIKEDE